MPGSDHSLVFESFGVIAEVVSDEPAVVERLPEVLPPDWRPTDADPATRFGLMADGTVSIDGAEVFGANADRDAALIRLGSLVRHELAVRAPEHVFIHAGVVSVGDRAIVIPGSSHSGKTTLVDELVRAGATYYSDEYAAVDPDGLILPYAKPLSIRGAGTPGPGALHPVAEERIATEPTRAGMVVVTAYERGATWRPEACTRGEGAFALLRHIPAARSRPGEALAVARAIVRDAQEVLTGTRGEASEMVIGLLRAAGSTTGTSTQDTIKASSS